MKLITVACVSLLVGNVLAGVVAIAGPAGAAPAPGMVCRPPLPGPWPIDAELPFDPPGERLGR